jgi:hypothetical protein
MGSGNAAVVGLWQARGAREREAHLADSVREQRQRGDE